MVSFNVCTETQFSMSGYRDVSDGSDSTKSVSSCFSLSSVNRVTRSAFNSVIMTGGLSSEKLSVARAVVAVELSLWVGGVTSELVRLEVGF
ncbi:hypothetical protein P9112_001706 [Eukaryota sp. TZLM1-RC]